MQQRNNAKKAVIRCDEKTVVQKVHLFQLCESRFIRSAAFLLD